MTHNARRMTNKRAVVLLSGGLDSAVTLYWARAEGYRCLALNFDYGQRHRQERLFARQLSRRTNTRLWNIRISLPWSKDRLTHGGRLPSRSLVRILSGKIPPTYVPARNTIFLAFALSLAESQKSEAILFGAHQTDSSGYPDCRPKYLEAFQTLGRYATRAGTEQVKSIRIIAPLIDLDKAGIIRLGSKLAVPFELTWSCYAGGDVPCGLCDSCRLRAAGFLSAGIPDPLLVMRRA